MPASLARAAVYLGLTAFALGCGGESFPLVPVAGRVTLDGQPLAGAHVAFEPVSATESREAGPGSYATTDVQGRYELVSLDGEPGAVVGQHRVSIRTFRGKPGLHGAVLTEVEEKVPPHYRDGLPFQVPPAGTTAADFALSSRL